MVHEHSTHCSYHVPHHSEAFVFKKWQSVKDSGKKSAEGQNPVV